MDVLKLKKLSKFFSRLDTFSIPVLMDDYCLSEKDANFVFEYCLKHIDSFKGTIVLTNENHNLYNVKEIKGNLIIDDSESIILWNCLKIIHGDLIIRSSMRYGNDHDIYFNNVKIYGTIKKENIFISYSSSTFNMVMETPNINGLIINL